jgi:hypothetical protein
LSQKSRKNTKKAEFSRKKMFRAAQPRANPSRRRQSCPRRAIRSIAALPNKKGANQLRFAPK